MTLDPKLGKTVIVTGRSKTKLILRILFLIQIVLFALYAAAATIIPVFTESVWGGSFLSHVNPPGLMTRMFRNLAFPPFIEDFRNPILYGVILLFLPIVMFLILKGAIWVSKTFLELLTNTAEELQDEMSPSERLPITLLACVWSIGVALIWGVVAFLVIPMFLIFLSVVVQYVLPLILIMVGWGLWSAPMNINWLGSEASLTTLTWMTYIGMFLIAAGGITYTVLSSREGYKGERWIRGYWMKSHDKEQSSNDN